MFSPKSLLTNLLAVICAFSTNAWAEVDGIVREAVLLESRGQARAAFDLLAPLESSRAGDPDFDLAFGAAANEIGNYPRAILALERANTVRPNQPRIQAELGRALFAVGDNKAAYQMFTLARTLGVPPGTARTIDQFLNAIARLDDAGRSMVHGYVETGFGYDTNVNSGPAGANIAVPAFGGLVLTLNPDAVRSKSSFAMLGGGLSARYVIDPRWSIIASTALSSRPNTSAVHEMSSSQGDVNAGLSYRHERNEYIIAAQAGTFEYDGRQLRRTGGGTVEWVHRLDGFRQWDSYVQYARLDYPNQSVRNTDRVVLGTTYAHRLRNGTLVYGGGYVGTENTRADGVDNLGHRLIGIRTGAQAPFTALVTAFATLGFEYRRFGGEDPLFLLRRVDQQATLNFGVFWDPAPKWRITPQLALTRVSSDSPVADFRKAVLSITARRDF